MDILLPLSINDAVARQFGIWPTFEQNMPVIIKDGQFGIWPAFGWLLNCYFYMGIFFFCSIKFFLKL